jgi:hypothetical protein
MVFWAGDHEYLTQFGTNVGSDQAKGKEGLAALEAFATSFRIASP